MVFDRSNGIYRSIFAALVGWLILVGAGKAPKAEAKAEQAKQQTEIADTLKDIRSALQDANKPDGTSQPCTSKQENRNSDLCAQWKAADAAANAADAGWWQMWVGVAGFFVGFLTLCAAAAAAVFAKKAADETEKGAKAATAAHESFVASERATIRVRSITFYQTPSGSMRASPYRVKLRVFNGGKASAIITEVQWSILHGPIFPEKPNFCEWRSEFIDTKGEGATLRSMTADDPKDGPVWIMGFFNYNSLGRKYRTHFCYQAKFNSDDGYTGAQWDTKNSICQNLPEDT